MRTEPAGLRARELWCRIHCRGVIKVVLAPRLQVPAATLPTGSVPGFGISGTNVHVVLKETWPSPPARSPADQPAAAGPPACVARLAPDRADTAWGAVTGTSAGRSVVGSGSAPAVASPVAQGEPAGISSPTVGEVVFAFSVQPYRSPGRTR
jgi:hypothetical protein